MSFKLKLFFTAAHRLLLNFGINIKLLKNFIFLPKYLLDFYHYKKKGKIDYFYPILGDNKKKAGDLDPHYFQQDLLVSKYIFKKKPKKHVDIGSRIDGFVAQVAAFRKIEIFDIRKINIRFNNIIFKKLNITNLKRSYLSYTDSLSCLHTIEHLGLGRYGDKIDVNGRLTKLEENSGGLTFNDTSELEETLARVTKKLEMLDKKVVALTQAKAPEPVALKKKAKETKSIVEMHTLIINTSPVGMFPNVHDAPPIAYEGITAQHHLYDLVYNPVETLFMKDGLAKGATVQNGLAMLHIQAEESWAIWNAKI